MKRSGGMFHRWGFWVLVAGSVMAGPVYAGAWNQPKGQGQVIVKYEPVRASDRFDANGNSQPIPDERRDHVLSVWSEYGLSDRVTLLAKADWQDTDDGFNQDSGIGPLEIGGRWQALDSHGWKLSVQGSYISLPQGRSASWGAQTTGKSEHEADIRVLAGRNFTRRRASGFYELQVGHRWRDNMASEIRAEGTLGVHIRQNYTAMAQFYAGKADRESGAGGARWLTLEAGVVRHWDDWSAQLGWRATQAGRNVPAGDGPIVALWRRF